LNLVIKKQGDITWLVREFKRENMSVSLESVGAETIVRLNEDIRWRLLTINHKRNGEHLVLQLKLDG
jgi:hypothetical protein